MIDDVMQILPEAWRGRLAENTEEIRLRVGYAPTACRGETSVPLSPDAVTPQLLERILNAATGRSPYVLAQSLQEGYFTLPGGERIGICGKCVCSGQAVQSIREISSLCIRMVHAPEGIGILPRRSALIIGPPGSGKTTLLRSCIRQLSERAGLRVGVADERGELAACVRGRAAFPLGRNTDILSDCPKALAMTMLVRTMSPQWLAVDEITRREDVLAVTQMSGCGVKLLATAHGGSAEELRRRPIYRMLLAQGIFEELLILGNDHSCVREEIG